jgi:hypothetical protein
MEMKMLPKIAVALCLQLALATVALAQAAPPADTSAAPPATESSDAMPQPLPGDHWSYAVLDEITGVLKATTTFTITDVTPAELAVRAEVLGSPNYGNFVYDHFWNVLKTPVWKFSPNDGSGIKLPLNPGGSWKFQSDQINVQHGASYRRSGTSKVVAQESVTTNAGTFDTYKIDTSVDIRNVNDPTKKESSTTTMWYAPSIDHWVKQTSKFISNGHVAQSTSVELLDYGRR